MEFGENLRKAREDLGITQQTLADQIFVTRQAVSRWECGARFPDLMTAKKLAEILNVSLDDLLSTEETIKCIEETPLIDSPVLLRLQTALYGFFSMTFFSLNIFTMYLIFSDNGNYLQSIFSDFSIFLNSMKSALPRFFIMLLMFYALFLAIRDRLTPKKIGFLPIFFCIAKLLGTFLTLCSHLIQYGTENLVIHHEAYLLMLLYVISLYLFYFHGKQLWRYGIYLYLLYGTGSLIFEYVMTVFSAVTIPETAFLFASLQLFAEIGFFLLTAYQTILLYRKRCRIHSSKTHFASFSAD